MTGKQRNIDVQLLVSELKRGLPAAPGQMSEQEFTRLCENIAGAIVSAVDQYDSGIRSLEPEFGEEDRVV